MLNNPVAIATALFIAMLLPFIIIVSTSFLKYSMVFSMLRTSLGLQQVPPNMVIYGLAIILTMYTMKPVITEVADRMISYKINLSDKKLYDKLSTSIEPYAEFLKRNTNHKHIDFFSTIGKEIWKTPQAKMPSKDSLVVLIPAFMVGQLIQVFEIGLLISLPFLAIDLIVSNLLLAMGMMMVPPTTISMAFKLLIFIVSGGWSLLVKQLLLSFH